MIGLVGYVLVPDGAAADVPDLRVPRHAGEIGGVNHGSGLVQLAANPYAAMPSLHAADALIVGIIDGVRLQALVGEGALARSGPRGSGSP